MRRSAMGKLTVAVALVAAGWGVGRAQTTTPDFEVIVDAPVGETRIECVRGCRLSWIERGLNPGANASPTFTFACSNTGDGRCSSARVGGWIEPKK